jgi:predicted anti-sigma-YlaC factor YlaD
MECDRAREAISARIDGEDLSVPADALEAHLAACSDCRGWQQRAHAMTRRARLGGPFLDRDLTGRVLAAIPPAPARRRLGLAVRAALIAAALGQLAVTVPLLFLSHDYGASAHAAHELGSFGLALAIAFAVGAARPGLAGGLAWPCGIAAASLAGTAVADLIGGQAPGADEAQHLIAVAGAVLLIWQARTRGTRTAGTAVRPGAGTGSGAPETGPVFWLEGPPQSPGGGTAAHVSAPDTAACPVPAARPAGGRPDQDGDGREAVA